MLHYNTHRYYDPITASYLTPDPLGLAVGPDLYAFALNRPHAMNDPLGLQPVPAQSVADWSTQDKLKYVFERVAQQYPGELGDALMNLVSPTALATTAAVFSVWAAAQFTPYGWAADVAIAGIGYIFLGKAIWDVATGIFESSKLIATAQCEKDLRDAADILAHGLGQAVAASAGGAAAAGMAKVAKLFRRVFKDSAPTTQKNATQAAITESWYGKFVPGRTRSGAVENTEYLAGRGKDVYAPWAKNRPVTDTWLNPGQKVFMVNGEGRAPGGWATNQQYTSLEEARKDLSLLEAFTKDKGKLVIQEYTVISPIPVRQGWAGPLEKYPGNGWQWEFLSDFRNDAWKKYLSPAVERGLKP